jgi:hypothetical protein
VKLAADRVRSALDGQFGAGSRSGIASFVPWAPCGPAELLERAAADLATPARSRPVDPRHPSVTFTPPQ